MATFRKYKSQHGATSFTATVRIAGFAPAAKTFPIKKAAAEWAATTEELLREQKKRASGIRREVAVLTVGESAARIPARSRDHEAPHVR